MRLVLPIIALATTVSVAEPRRDLAVAVTLHQNAVLLTSPTVTAGGLGGGVGVQLAYADRYLAQADVGAQWMIGSPITTRFALGVQRRGEWAPAAWLALTALWGDRVEIVMEPGGRPRWPAVGVGIRISPLRYRSALGTVSAIEGGLALASNGTLLDLTVLQVSASW